MFRAALRWTTAWLFFWGVVILGARFAGYGTLNWVIPGIGGALIIASAAAFSEWRRRPAFARLRAEYDLQMKCGGLIMSEEAGNMTAWRSQFPPSLTPRLKWNAAPSFLSFVLSLLFVFVAMALPDRLTMATASHQLEVGQLIEELKAEVELLKEEKILEDKKADELEQQLSRIQDETSGLDPNRTWEALDHIKESNADLAQQAAEEALAKLTALNQAEALATALQSALEAGLEESTATRAAQDLASMLKNARLEEGLLDLDLPADLMSALEGLDPESLEKLLQSLQANKGKLTKVAARLQQLKLIDAKMLGACENAGKLPNCDGLAAFLCDSGGDCDSFSQLAISYCRGGINRGRGDAPMTWTDPSTEDGARFKEEVLPPSALSSDTQLVGVSRAAPELSSEDVVVESGALASAQGQGGTAHARNVLPRHQASVRRFFAREE